MSSAHHAPRDYVLPGNLGDILMDQVVQTTVFMLIYGIFCLLYSQLIVVYLKKYRPSRGQLCIFFISNTTFLVATIHGSALLAYTGIMVHSALTTYQDLPLAQRLPLVYRAVKGPDAVWAWTAKFGPVVSDCVVIWRAYVLLQKRRRLVILPLLLLLGSAGSFLAYLTIYSMKGWNNLGSNLNQAGVSLSLGANVVTTGLIGHVYWLHKTEMVPTTVVELSDNNTERVRRRCPTRVEQVLALFVESGIVFCLIQAINFILGLLTPHEERGTARSYAYAVFKSVHCAFAAMYPTMVIVMVDRHCTLDKMYTVDISLRSVSQRVGSSGTALHFALPDPTASAESVAQPVEKRDNNKAI